MNENKLQQLEAENIRLKRIMKRMYQGVLGTPSNSPKDGQTISKGYFPLYISTLLEAEQPFSNRINNTLAAIGDFIDVSRIYIFENNNIDNNILSNTFEWCNNGVNPEIDNLQNLSYAQYPEWRRMLIDDGFIKASNIKQQLPNEVHECLNAQNIKALLVYPLWVKDEFFGFIGFDECSFYREWLPHETDFLQMVAHLISNSFEKEKNHAQLNKHVEIQQLILDISHTLNSDDNFDVQLNKALHQLINHFNNEHTFLYENINNNTQCKNIFEHSPKNNSDITFSNNTVLTYNIDLKGWLESFEKDGIYNSRTYYESNSEADQEICSIIAIPIRSENQFWGFIGFKNCSPDYNWNISHKKALFTIADMLSNSYQRRIANTKLRQSHAEILKINKDLSGKEQFLNNILASAPVGILLIRNRKIEYINNATMAHSGYSRDELIGRSLADLYFDGKQNLTIINNFYHEIDKNGVASMDSHMKSKDGSEIILRVLGTPAANTSDDNSYLLIAEDITQIKKTEINLRESEERNRKLIEATIDGIFIVKSNMQVAYANTSACNMLAYSKKEILDLKVNNIFPSNDHMIRFSEIVYKIESGNDFIGDTQLIDKNNELIHAEIYATTLKLEGEVHYFFSIHNITKRKNNEVSLINSERKFRALTENSPDHIVRIDNHGIITYCNTSFLNEFELTEKNCSGRILTNINELPKELTSGLASGIKEVMSSASAKNIELEFRYKDKILAFDWTITPETDNNLKLSSTLIIGRNFTQKKIAEQELVVAKEKAIGADKLKSAFLANMSHEIRTPLNAIVGFTNLLKEENITESEKIEYIDIINKSSENLMELINDIVDLAKIESGELNLTLESCNVIQLLKELHLLFEKRMAIDQKTHLKFYLNLPDDNNTLNIDCDHRRLRQIFINLLGNAFKFTQKGFIEFGYTKEENNIRFYVRDTGIGINPDKQSVIFEPFRQADESTSKNYGGTGLGLSICKRLVAVHSGNIGLISEPATGSEFYFTIPLNKPKTNGIKSSNIKTKAIEQTKVIMPANYTWTNKMMLLIDATSSAQLQMRKVLERTKITLMSARTQNSARELLLKRNDIHIVLIDLEMPGLELSNFIPSIRQMGIYVPFVGQTSQKLSQEAKNKYLTMGFDHVFEKPIEIDELLHAFNASLLGINTPKTNIIS